MRAAQPALRDRRVRIERALEGDLLEIGRERAHHQEQVGILGRRRHPQLGRDRPGDLDLVLERLGQECDAVAEARIGDGACRFLRRGRHRHVGRMQIELGPLGARERPLALVPLDEFLAGMAHLQQHLRLLAPAGVLALEEMAEELLLQLRRHSPCRNASSARCRAPRAISAPTRRARSLRNCRADAGPARPSWRTRTAASSPCSSPACATASTRRCRACARCSPRRSRGGSGRAALPTRSPGPDTQSPFMRLLKPRVPRPFCTRVDLRLRPVLHEAAAEDAAVMRHVAVEIGGAFPQADRGEMLGLQRRGLPLVLGVVGDAVEADLAVRPGLHAGPVDALRQVLRLAQRPDVDDARASGRRRGCRRGCRRSRPAPISPDRPPPSTDTCWSSRSARPDGRRTCAATGRCRDPRSAATCRTGRRS